MAIHAGNWRALFCSFTLLATGILGQKHLQEHNASIIRDRQSCINEKCGDHERNAEVKLRCVMAECSIKAYQIQHSLDEDDVENSAGKQKKWLDNSQFTKKWIDSSAFDKRETSVKKKWLDTLQFQKKAEWENAEGQFSKSAREHDKQKKWGANEEVSMKEKKWIDASHDFKRSVDRQNDRSDQVVLAKSDISSHSSSGISKRSLRDIQISPEEAILDEKRWLDNSHFAKKWVDNNQLDKKWVDSTQFEKRWLEDSLFQKKWLDNPQFTKKWLDNPQFTKKWLDNPQFTKKWLDNPQFTKKWLDNPQFTKKWLDNPQFQKKWIDNSQFQKKWVDGSQLDKRWLDNSQFQKKWIDNSEFQKKWLDNPQFQKKWLDNSQFQKKWLDSSQFSKKWLDNPQFQKKWLDNPQFQKKWLDNSQFQKKWLDNSQFQKKWIDSSEFNGLKREEDPFMDFDRNHKRNDRPSEKSDATCHFIDCEQFEKGDFQNCLTSCGEDKRREKRWIDEPSFAGEKRSVYLRFSQCYMSHCLGYIKNRKYFPASCLKKCAPSLF